MGLTSVRDQALGVGQVVASRYLPADQAAVGGIGWYVAFVEAAFGAPQAGPTGEETQNVGGRGTVYGGSASAAVSTRPGGSGSSGGSGVSSIDTSAPSSDPGSPSTDRGLHCSVVVTNSVLTGVGARMTSQTLRRGAGGYGLRVGAGGDAAAAAADGGGRAGAGASSSYAVLSSARTSVTVSAGGNGTSSISSDRDFSPYLLLAGGADGLSAALSSLEYAPGQDWSGGVKVMVKVWDNSFAAAATATAGGGGGGGGSGSSSGGGGSDGRDSRGTVSSDIPEAVAVIHGIIQDAPLVPTIFFRGAQV